MRLRDLQQAWVLTLQTKATSEQSMSLQTLLSKPLNHAVYQDSIEGALQKTLQAIYPVCLRLVGNDFFNGMIYHYIRETPSCSPDLSDYGHTFPDFIKRFDPANGLPYLSDIARLECTWHQLENAPASIPADYHQLDEQSLLQRQPSCVLLSSPYPLLKIWEANQPTGDHEEIITLEPNTIYYLILWRQCLTIHIDTLSQAEWTMLHWLQEKISLKALYENFKLFLPNHLFDELLPTLFQKGWLTIGK